MYELVQFTVSVALSNRIQQPRTIMLRWRGMDYYRTKPHLKLEIFVIKITNFLKVCKIIDFPRKELLISCGFYSNPDV